MFDLGDVAIGNVRKPRDLRWRRNDNRYHDAHYDGDVWQHGDVGSIDVIGNLGDVGRVDILWNAGNVGIVGNVRCRLKQHRGIVESNINIAYPTGRQRSKRRSVRILPDWQSWGQSSIDGPDTHRIAHNRQRGEFGAGNTNDARGFSTHGKSCAMTAAGAPAEAIFICERDRP
jgi:hypothetical protein